MKKVFSIKRILNPCKLYCLLGFFLLVGLDGFSQFTVTIRLKGVAAAHVNDVVFVAGNFNGWDPAKPAYQLRKNNGFWEVLLTDRPKGLYQFKFARGSWQKVECTSDGADVENRTFNLVGDTVLEYSVLAWKDDFVPVQNNAVADVEKVHTASARVQLLDSAFDIPQLNRKRRVWIYLPVGYSTGKKHYPVIYMQDGQNVFDKYTSAFGEWGVDECLDSMTADGAPGCIVVGIDNDGEHRMSEYNPYPFTWKDSTASKTFAAEGDAYIDFITQTLKPFIDVHFRTFKNKEQTIIAGSSMGGLIAYYAMLKYPAVFGKAGIFSPAFWTAPAIEDFTDSVAGKISGKFFFYIGGQEGKRYVDDMVRVEDELGEKSSAMVYSIIDNEGKHNEAAWRKWFGEFYKWIIADGYNVITKE